MAAGLTAGGAGDGDRALDELVQRADLDGLVRLIDARCESRDWAGLLRVRDRALAAVDTGRQVWPAATLAEFRLALHAPAEWAAAVLDEHSGRFTIGPLSEVVAQHHTWDELVPYLDAGPRALFVAHERALRGEEIVADDLPPVLDIPVTMQPWEPDYVVATYRDVGSEFPSPPLPTDLRTVDALAGAPVVADDDTELAVRQLVEPWTGASNGRAEVVCVEGGVAEALGALGLRTVRVAAIETPVALAWLAWAGASGGAHGRRRGAAIGRYGMWWLIGALGDLHDDWPPTTDQVEEVLADQQWYWWDASEPVTGWRLQLAVEDAGEGVAWAINARDDA